VSPLQLPILNEFAKLLSCSLARKCSRRRKRFSYPCTALVRGFACDQFAPSLYQPTMKFDSGEQTLSAVGFRSDSGHGRAFPLAPFTTDATLLLSPVSVKPNKRKPKGRPQGIPVLQVGVVVRASS
jgi:hypothetical protein